MLQKVQFLQPQARKKLRAEYHEARAMAYAAMGNTKAAKTWFAKALALADAPSKLANRIAKRMAECDKAS